MTMDLHEAARWLGVAVNVAVSAGAIRSYLRTGRRSWTDRIDCIASCAMCGVTIAVLMVGQGHGLWPVYVLLITALSYTVYAVAKTLQSRKKIKLSMREMEEIMNHINRSHRARWN